MKKWELLGIVSLLSVATLGASLQTQSGCGNPTVFAFTLAWYPHDVFGPQHFPKNSEIGPSALFVPQGAAYHNAQLLREGILILSDFASAPPGYVIIAARWRPFSHFLSGLWTHWWEGCYGFYCDSDSNNYIVDEYEYFTVPQIARVNDPQELLPCEQDPECEGSYTTSETASEATANLYDNLVYMLQYETPPEDVSSIVEIANNDFDLDIQWNASKNGGEYEASQQTYDQAEEVNVSENEVDDLVSLLSEQQQSALAMYNVSTPEELTSLLKARQASTVSSSKTQLARQESTNQANVLDDFKLEQNYPNPFNPSTEISFALPQESHVLLEVYDVTGHLVAKLMDDVLSKGRHSVTWDGRDEQGKPVASGTYFYQVRAGSFTQVKTMVLVK